LPSSKLWYYYSPDGENIINLGYAGLSFNSRDLSTSEDDGYTVKVNGVVKPHPYGSISTSVISLYFAGPDWNTGTVTLSYDATICPIVSTTGVALSSFTDLVVQKQT